MAIKTGARLASQTCATQVIVVRTGDGLDDLRCGGAPMVPVGTEAETLDLDPQFADGSLIGKRYVAGDDIEVLVTKPGAGSLSIGTEPLTIKAAKPLPASD